MRLSSGKVSELLSSISQQRPRETHCRVRNCLLLGQLVRNMGELNLRSCTAQSNWPCPQALYCSWMGLFRTYFSAEPFGKPWVCVDAEQKNVGILENLLSWEVCFSPRFPYQFLFPEAVDSARIWDFGGGKTAKNIIAESSSSQFTWEHYSMPVSQLHQSTRAIALFSAAWLPTIDTRWFLSSGLVCLEEWLEIASENDACSFQSSH